MDLFARIGRSFGPVSRALVVAGSLAVFGCANGRTHMSDMQEAQLRDFVEQNYENLLAYYSGNRERPGAILMDLKNDSVTLIAKKWEPINSKGELLELMDRMVRVYYRKMEGKAGFFGPRLQSVLDKDDKLIGYFYSPVDNWPVRTEGPNYSVDWVTYVQVLEWSQQELIRPARKARR